ncbi:hypothetical protein BZM27_39105 [Paraburkholderia steynii]|uniref:Uncharacterized protein n=1 Tax=Paraburkholderia steynii TaxID=1245441 RepID=A0A4R0XCW9_9BURK|nr:hypothetical protein BZM27_39105 [Paraburkholderia steynii]
MVAVLVQQGFVRMLQCVMSDCACRLLEGRRSTNDAFAARFHKRRQGFCLPCRANSPFHRVCCAATVSRRDPRGASDERHLVQRMG